MLGGLKVVEGRVVLLTEVEELGVAGLELGVVGPEVELGLFGVRGDRRLAGHLLPAAVADVHGVGVQGAVEVLGVARAPVHLPK